MTDARLLLLHSPLTGPEVWGRLAPELRSQGRGVGVPAVRDDDRPPYAARYVAAVVRQVDPQDGPAVLVAHSGAGPLVGMLGAALRAARVPVAGYALVDAGLPRPGGATRLALMEGEDAAFAAGLHADLHAGARFPAWTDADLAHLVPDPRDRVALLGGLRPRRVDFFEEPVACPGDWPDAPAVYLRTSPAYDAPLRQAVARGWPTSTVDAGHFAMLADPAGTASALMALLR